MKRILSTAQRIGFYNELATLFENRVNIFNALNDLNELADRFSDLKSLRPLYRDCIVALREGEEMEFAMRGRIPETELVLFQAAMASDSPAQGLRQAAKLAETKQQISMVVVKEMAWPMFLLMSFFGFCVLIAYKVIPTVSSIIPKEKIATGAPFLIDFVDFVNIWVPVIFVCTIVTIGLIIYSLPRWIGNLRDNFDNIPPWNVYRIISSATMLASLSTLLSSSVKLKKALETIQSLSSPWMAFHIEKVLDAIKEGDTPESAFSKSFLPGRIIASIVIYTKAKSFEKSLNTIFENLTEDVIKSIKSSIVALKYGVMISVVVFMSFVIMKVFTIMYSIKDLIQ